VPAPPDRFGPGGVTIGPAGPVPLAGSDGYGHPVSGGRVSGDLPPVAGLAVIVIPTPRTVLMRDDAERLEETAASHEWEAAALDPGGGS